MILEVILGDPNIDPRNDPNIYPYQFEFVLPRDPRSDPCSFCAFVLNGDPKNDH